MRIPTPLVATGTLAAVLALLPATAGAGQVSRAAMLASSCAGCHGTDGASPGAIPSIAGKSATFIERALKEFRAGTRPATVMDRHAKGYTDEEIELIAEFFASK
ncbi:MAG: cytochrome C [Gammaproteobacteria bacterium]|nr:cytochrome C [Gammaproteobacteria bacterium]NIR82321.1 cytochrome C [Gammaproteobacteria bacterium]NIV76459.1 cytochrome C [Gammaproteobacteria bacterium]